jgi:hypothetical protein
VLARGGNQTPPVLVQRLALGGRAEHPEVLGQIGRTDRQRVDAGDGGDLVKPRDPLAIAFGRADHHWKVHGPRERGHVGHGLDRERRMLHVDPGEVETGGLAERQHGRRPDHRHPGADLHLAALGATR